MHNIFAHSHLKILGMLSLSVMATVARGAEPVTAHAQQPAADRWMYPNNPTPGSRATGSTFSFLPFTGVDDRFGQFVIKFDTAAMGIPPGLGTENYKLHRLCLTTVYASNDLLPYDPTEDPLASLGAAASMADADAGRPLELHGTGFRGGFTAMTFLENSVYGSRNAFALGFDASGQPRDVSNNVTMGYESSAWAIGKVSVPVDLNAEPRVYQSIAAGEVIPVYSHITFEVDFSTPGVADYVKQGLHQGALWFSLSSFHPVTGVGSSGFPSYFSKEHPEQAIYQDVAPTLELVYSLPLNIITFHRDYTGNVQLTWNASPGFQYVIEESSDLASGSWQPLQTLIPQAVESLHWSAHRASSRSFFRIARSVIP